MTLLAFLFAIGLLVTVHEWGHYRMAVACGVKVHTFSIGFGPTLFKWRAKRPRVGQETEFQVGLLPLGGYVRMVDEREGEVAASDVSMAFNRQPLRSRAAIVLAGPMANFVLAIVLFALMNVLGRYETAPVLSAPVSGSVAYQAGLRSGDEVLRVGLSGEAMTQVRSLESLRMWIESLDDSSIFLEVKSEDGQAVRVVQLESLSQISMQSDGWVARGLTSAWTSPVLGEVMPDEPAAVAGLQRGDLVLKVDGRRVGDAFELRNLIRQSGTVHAPNDQTWEIRRGDQILLMNVLPLRVQDGSLWVGRVGAQIGQPPLKVWIQSDFGSAMVQALEQTWQNTRSTAEMLLKLLAGKASWDHVGGPLMIADYAGRTAQIGLGVYVGYLAMLSVSLGVFNLLPLPVLDGGHLLYYLYEFVTGKSPSEQWHAVMQRLSFALLLSVMIFSFLNDAVRMGWVG